MENPRTQGSKNGIEIYQWCIAFARFQIDARWVTQRNAHGIFEPWLWTWCTNIRILFQFRCFDGEATSGIVNIFWTKYCHNRRWDISHSRTAILNWSINIHRFAQIQEYTCILCGIASFYVMSKCIWIQETLSQLTTIYIYPIPEHIFSLKTRYHSSDPYHCNESKFEKKMWKLPEVFSVCDTRHWNLIATSAVSLNPINL